MTSLSTQNRSRILDCLSVLESSLNSDEASSESNYEKRVSQLKNRLSTMHKELTVSSERLEAEPVADDSFVDEFLSSGCFSGTLAQLKEAEGSNWGKPEIVTLSECMKDIARSFSEEERDIFRDLVNRKPSQI